MAVKAKDLKIGQHYQVGNPMKGILKLNQINVPRAMLYGDFLDIKNGGINNRGVKLNDLVREMRFDRVYFYRKQFILELLSF